MPLPSGKLIRSRYEIRPAPGFSDNRTTLGSGSFGITYYAHDRSLDRPVAIKEYFPAGIATRTRRGVGPVTQQRRKEFDKGVEEFLDEARALASVSHHNVVKVLDYFDGENGTAYMVMEYVDGPNLLEWLGDKDVPASERRTLDEAGIKDLLKPLMGALQQLHERTPTLLHRDIKPNNIMLRRNGEGEAQVDQPVLIDFGAARQIFGADTQNLTSYLTHGYAPTEQYTEQLDDEADAEAVQRLNALPKQGPWSDIHALAAVCYRALTGRRPMSAATRQAYPASFKALSAEKSLKASPKFLSVIDKAMALDPRNRYQSVAEWRQALEKGAGAIGPIGQWREALAVGLLSGALAFGVGLLIYLNYWPTVDRGYRGAYLLTPAVGGLALGLASFLSWMAFGLQEGKSGVGRVLLNLLVALVLSTGLLFVAGFLLFGMFGADDHAGDLLAQMLMASLLTHGAGLLLHTQAFKRRTASEKALPGVGVGVGLAVLLLSLLLFGTTLGRLSPAEQAQVNEDGRRELYRAGYDTSQSSVIEQFQRDIGAPITNSLTEGELERLRGEKTIDDWVVCAVCEGKGRARSVAEAVRRAVAPQTVIRFEPGTYSETVTKAGRIDVSFQFVGDRADASKVTLKGNGADPIVTLGGGDSLAGVTLVQSGSGDAILVSGNSAKVEDVAIRDVGDYGAGVRVQGGNASLSRLHIGTIRGTGVWFVGSGSGQIADSQFRQTGRNSILASGTGSVQATGNIIVNPQGNGIYFKGQTGGTIANNQISGATSFPAIFVGDTSSPNIFGNQVTGSGPIVCVVAAGESAPTIRGNKFNNCNDVTTALVSIEGNSRARYGPGQTDVASSASISSLYATRE